MNPANHPRRIAVWGSTGSIGTQTLYVAGRHPGRFEIETLTAHTNAESLLAQAFKWHPKTVVLTGTADRKKWEPEFRRTGAKVMWGREGLLEAASGGEEELVVNGLVGAVGLEATLKAVDAGKSIALANKEVLVMAGGMVMDRVKRKGVRLLPVDSEHSAILQCLAGEDMRLVDRILLTASGGPFRERPVSTLAKVTVAEALAHPNWNMGKKVTIDSATLVNKGLEVMEARWLFDMPPERVVVVIHPQSIVHSMVAFRDGSIKAQLGIPDMRIPISYALGWPERLPEMFSPMDWSRDWELRFMKPDPERYPALRLAYEALRTGGTAPAVLNAADEVAVALFLEEKITFDRIPAVIEKALEKHAPVMDPSLEDILEADRAARVLAAEAIL